MGMTQGYGPAADEREMIVLLSTAVDRGITFFDTAQVYGPHVNEELLGKAWRPARPGRHRNEVRLSHRC